MDFPAIGVLQAREESLIRPSKYNLPKIRGKHQHNFRYNAIQNWFKTKIYVPYDMFPIEDGVIQSYVAP